MRPDLSNPWRQSEIDALMYLWKRGRSAREIAAVLGRTHNAIVSKRRRLGLQSRPSPIIRKAS